MQKIYDKYHEVTKNLKPREDNNYNSKKFLPIGLVSSSVIANYVLQNLDEDIINNVKPEYYSRYVDDMLFVFSNADINIESKTIVADLLSNKLKSSKIKNIGEDVSITNKDRIFKLQNKKVNFSIFIKMILYHFLINLKKKLMKTVAFLILCQMMKSCLEPLNPHHTICFMTIAK